MKIVSESIQRLLIFLEQHYMDIFIKNLIHLVKILQCKFYRFNTKRYQLYFVK